MSKFVALALIALGNLVLGAVVALEEGPIALTAIFVFLGAFTQLAVVAMVVAEARPDRATPGDG